MLSFWEKESYIKAEYIIVGGGITGLSTAISIKEKQPKARVLVLERGLFPSGASTRNAGFACFGSLTELLIDKEAMGEEQALMLVEERWRGLEMLRRRVGDARLAYLRLGGYELIREQEMDCLQHMDAVNEWLKPLFGQDLFSERSDLLSNFGFSRSHVKTLIYNPLEGQVHTGQMMQALAAIAAAAGVEIYTGAQVTQLQEDAAGVEVLVKDTARGTEIAFRCARLAICTNAFAKQFLPHLNLQPGRGQVLVTEPLEKLPFQGVFHMNEGYYYFRNIGRRIMLGGGRNLDFKTETTTQLNLNDEIQQALDAFLQEVIVPDTPVRVEQRWSGIMAFGPVKQPVVEKISSKMVAGVRLGGMGVAIGSRMGERLAQLLFED